MPDWFPQTLTETVAFVPLRILFLVVVAVLARIVLHRLINQAVARAVGTAAPRRHGRRTRTSVLLDAAGLPSERRAQRLAALASLGRSAVTAVLFVVTALMILAELGFPVTTLVAGTSVVALTVGFGIQSIVKDLISGLFLLAEDQLGVGDYVDLEKASGTVEAIGLRVTKLRDDSGTQWYVRNGEVVRVANYSQGGPGRPPEPELEPAST